MEPPVPPHSRPKPINWSHLVTITSASVLVGVEVIAAGFAGGWALGGLFGLGDTGTLILEALGVALGLYAVYAFARNAMRVEPIRA
jgi:hypothetical protein